MLCDATWADWPLATGMAQSRGLEVRQAGASADGCELAALVGSPSVRLRQRLLRLGLQDRLAQPQQLGIANAEWLCVQRSANFF
jgi:hypothetical protein